MPVPSRVRIAVLLLFATAFRPLHATDLTSSEVGYKLSRADNPFVVVPGAIIDTRGNGAVAIDASGSSGWALTNNGTVYGGYNAVHLPLGTLTNFGVLASPGTTAVAMFAGGTVVNHAGAVIAGKLDGIYLGQSGSIVINAGDIAGDVFDYSSTQAAIHFAESGTVVNLATGRIVGHAHGILATPALTLDNAGLIASDEGAAIDLHSGPSAPASIVNSGTINGRSGVAIAFGPADDRLEISGTSRITGVVDGGAAGSAGNMLVLGGADAGSFDLSALGPAAQYRNFGVLQKQGTSIWTLTGANLDEQAWQVGGGGFVVAGQLTGSLTAQPGVTGLYIEVARGGVLQSPTTSAITLNGGSQIVNAGTITASGAGVPAIRIGGADGPASVVNQPGATIAGSQGPAIVAGANVAIVNAGTLSGSGVAVQFTGANSTLTLDTGSALSGELDGGNGAGNALILQGSGSLPGRAYSFPNFYMRGTDWLLDGTAEIGTSATVETGTLRVNGTLASPAVAVSPGAALAGTGTVQGAVSVQGIVAPGNTVLPTTPRAPLSVGTLSVVGSYSHAAGAVYQVDVSPTSNDLIDVTGRAALAGGMVQARLRALSLRPADTYRILSASGGLTGTFAGVTTLNPFATPSLAYDAGNAYLVVARGFALAGGTPNEIAVETALDRDAFAAGTNNAPSRDFLSVALELFNQEGAGAYAAIDQLSAEAYAALPNAHYAAARAGMNAIDTRLADNTCTGAVPAGRFCAWATVLGNTGRIGGYDTWLSQDINLAGVMAGVDYQWTPAFTGGMAFGYLHGNTFTHGLPVHGQFDSYQAVLYGRYTAGRYWFRQALGYARNIDDMRRDITFTEVPRTATGGAHGNQFFTALRTGVDLPLALPGVLSPFAGAELQSVKLSGTVESGADSVNLVLPSRTTHSVRSLLGTEWRHLFDGPGGAWRIDAAAAWVHTFGTNTLAINARYAGAPATDFTVHGSGQNRNAAQLRLGMSVSPTPRSRLSIRYDGELGTHGSTHGGAVGFSYHW